MTSPAGRRRVLLPLAALLAGTLVLSSCGGLGATTDAAGGPGGGGAKRTKLVLGLSRQLTSLDPGNSGSLDSDATVQSVVFSGLTTVGPDLKLAGDLATSWTQKDATTWEFELRPGVVFSDGTPLDADGVVWNFQRVADPANKLSQGGSLRAVVERVEAPDATTVVITTKGPYLDLANRLSNFYFVSKDFVAGHNPKTETLGTGPYRVVKADLETGVTLEANPRYYGARPAIENVEYKVLASEASRVAAAKAGEVDIAIMYDPTDLAQFTGSDQYDSGSQWSTWNMTLRINETKKPLDDRRVRQALNYAVDKATIARSLLGADAKPSPGQALTEGYDVTNPALSAYPYDPEKAKALLAEAGHGDGLDLDLEIPSGTYIAADSIVEVVATQLAKVDIRAKIGGLPFPAWVDKSRTPDVAHLIYIGYSSGYPSTAERLAIYRSDYDQSHFEAPAYDDLVAQARKAPDAATQKDLINQATRLAHDDPHVIYLWPQPLTWVKKKDLDWTIRPEHWLRAHDVKPK